MVNSAPSAVWLAISVDPSGVASMPFKLKPVGSMAAAGPRSASVTPLPSAPRAPIGIL
jgi:hypothetical protein